jgi:hypothetical protein
VNSQFRGLLHDHFWRRSELRGGLVEGRARGDHRNQFPLFFEAEATAAGVLHFDFPFSPTSKALAAWCGFRTVQSLSQERELSISPTMWSAPTLSQSRPVMRAAGRAAGAALLRLWSTYSLALSIPSFLRLQPELAPVSADSFTQPCDRYRPEIGNAGKGCIASFPNFPDGLYPCIFQRISNSRGNADHLQQCVFGKIESGIKQFCQGSFSLRLQPQLYKPADGFGAGQRSFILLLRYPSIQFVELIGL